MFSYELITRNSFRMSKDNLIIYWLTIMIFIILTSFLFLKSNMASFYENNAIVIDDNKMSTAIGINDLSKIVNNKTMRIGDNTFSYKVVAINDIDSYKEIILEIDDGANNNKAGSIISYRIEDNRKNIVKEIFKYFRGIK